MKSMRTILILVLSLVLSVPVFAKRSHGGGRSRSPTHPQFTRLKEVARFGKS